MNPKATNLTQSLMGIMDIDLTTMTTPMMTTIREMGVKVVAILLETMLTAGLEKIEVFPVAGTYHIPNQSLTRGSQSQHKIVKGTISGQLWYVMSTLLIHQSQKPPRAIEISPHQGYTVLQCLLGRTLVGNLDFHRPCCRTMVRGL